MTFFKNTTAVLCGIFFLSGASALVFELLWFQLAGLTFGNSVWAGALVLASFMGGLALGSGLAAFWGHKIKFPIRTYAFIEILIAISGFSLVLIFPKLTPFLVPIYRPLLDHSFILNSLKAMIAFCLMVAPSAAMGATLPILVKALYSRNPGFGRVLGILYGWNTFGAMVGVVTAELFLIKLFGIRGSGLFAAGLNLLAATTAIWVYKINKREHLASKMVEKPFVYPTFSQKMMRLLLGSFLSGLTLLALEVIWFRFMLLFFSATSWNFAVMLAAVLFGIGLGGLSASRWFRLRSNAHRFLMPVLVFNGMLIILIYTNFKSMYVILKGLGVDADVQIVFLSLFLMFPVSFVSGNIFTMLGKALHKEMESETRATGLLTLANTAGGMFGSLIAGFIFIPYLGIEKSFFIFALSYGMIAFIVFEKEQFIQLKKKLSIQHVAIAAYFICLMIFPFGFMNIHYLKIPFTQYNMKGERQVAVREGVSETIQYFQKDLLNKPYYHRLVTNNHSMSATTLGAKRYMKAFVYWPIAIHPEIKDVLLICYGCGMTAKALTDTKSIKNIEIVDISRDIIMESKVVFPNPGENPIHDPRVKIHIEDGRFFLLTRERKFDLITAEPPPPTSRGIVSLYTQEYFQLIYDHLSEGGIVTYWLPVYQLKVSESKSILKGFCNVFKENSLWAGSGFEWMMIGIKNPGKPVNEKDFIRQWNDPIVGPEMRSLGFESPEQFGAFFIADGPRLRNWISSSLPLTDNYPKRLSSYVGPMPVDTYIDFMDYTVSKENFLNSEGITKIWPESLRKKSGKYFSSSQIINELLIPLNIWRKYTTDITYLHQCIHNPLLENYILWVLGSNQYAQRIISIALKEKPAEQVEGPGTYIHFAANALQEKNYLLSEHYLHLLVDFLSRTNLLDDYHHFNYCTLRIYLLTIAGDKTRAKQVGEEYLDFIEKKEGKEKRVHIGIQFDKYMDWLDQTLNSN
jgi:spermidine synthase